MNKNTKRAKAIGLSCAPDQWPTKSNDTPMRNGKRVQEVLKGQIKTSFPGTGCKRKSPHRYPTKKDLSEISE